MANPRSHRFFVVVVVVVFFVDWGLDHMAIPLILVS